MGIIVLLAAILVPVVSQVRMRGYVVSTQGQMQRIAAALDSYFHDFKAYPGPLPNSQLVGQPNAGNSTFTVTTTQTPTPVIKAAQITSSENLVLGLLGILSTPTAPGQPVTYSGLPPAHDVMGLNPLRPASYHYIDYIPEELSFPTGYAYANRLGIMDTTTGTNKLLTDANAQLPVPNGQQPSVNAQAIGNDTQVPEFMDRIPDFMPILYIRANVGIAAPGDGTGIATTDMKSRPAQYDVTQLAPYGFNQVSFTPPIAAGSADYTLPAGMTITTDAAWVAYFMNPAINGQARGKDGFVLISAGADRLYGTKDDIIVTP